MSGFETGNSQGIRSTAQQYGKVLRGYGPPAPTAGVNGALYIDVLTWQLFQRREEIGLDPWGHYLFTVPALYQPSLNYFGTSAPSDDLGVVGDYYLQFAGWPNYGMSMIVYGPKQWSGWPENGDGPGVVIAAGTGNNVLPVGELAEGATVVDRQPSQLIVVGLAAEYVIPVPVTAADGETVLQVGLQSNGVYVPITPNTLYTAEDEHSI
jgi:hypothetical protein